MSETVLVTGASGNTGSPLVAQLGSEDVTVRAMVRHQQPADALPENAVHVHADFGDPTALQEALAGVDRAYLVTPSSQDAEAQQMLFVQLAAAAGVQHIVYLSQLAAAADSPVRFLRYHAAVERRIQELGLGYTFLRPNLFFQGLLGLAEAVKSQHQLFAPIGDARVSAIDVRDIAAVAAIALTRPGHLGQTYTLTGPAAITHTEMANAIGAATGHDVAFVDISVEQFADTLGEVLPQWQVDGLVEDYAHYRRGEAAAVSPAVERVTGSSPRDITTFARDYADAFR